MNIYLDALQVDIYRHITGETKISYKSITRLGL